MRCVAMLRHAAMLVTCRAALTEPKFGCIRSKSVGYGLEYEARGPREARHLIVCCGFQ
jgi:hypothetical protein